MGKHVDYSEIEKLNDRIRKELNQQQMDEFYERIAKQITARLLAKVIKRTPVGVYPHRVGGTLRRGWTGGKKTAQGAYVESMMVKKKGYTYEITVKNPVKYASYVEYGHRTRDHKGWVKGQFFLKISEDEIRDKAPKIIEKELKKKLEGVFGG